MKRVLCWSIYIIYCSHPQYHKFRGEMVRQRPFSYFREDVRKKLCFSRLVKYDEIFAKFLLYSKTVLYAKSHKSCIEYFTTSILSIIKILWEMPNLELLHDSQSSYQWAKPPFYHFIQYSYVWFYLYKQLHILKFKSAKVLLFHLTI